jgi:hypothetical protein
MATVALGVFLGLILCSRCMPLKQNKKEWDLPLFFLIGDEFRNKKMGFKQDGIRSKQFWANPNPCLCTKSFIRSRMGSIYMPEVFASVLNLMQLYIHYCQKVVRFWVKNTCPNSKPQEKNLRSRLDCNTTPHIVFLQALISHVAIIMPFMKELHATSSVLIL